MRSELNDQPVDLDLSLRSEKANDVISRIFFESSSNDVITFNDSIRLSRPNAISCTNASVYLAQVNKDFLNPVKLSLRYKLSDKPTQQHRPRRRRSESRARTTPMAKNDDADGDLKLEFPKLTEVLNNQHFAANVGIEHQVDFVKNCGEDSQCQSNLKVQGILQMDRDEIGQYILRVGQDEEMKLFVRIANREEDAHETILTVLLPECLKYRGTNTEGRQYSCLPEGGAVHCNIGNPLQSTHETSFALRLDTSNIDYSIDRFEIILLVNTTSIENDVEDNHDILKVKVILETDLFVKGSSDPVEVFYGGEVIGESAMSSLEDIGSAVKHSYEIKNVGKGRVPNVNLRIHWPYEVQSTYPHGKHLLYLTDPPQIEDNRTKCFLDLGIVNQLGLKARTVDDQTTSKYNRTYRHKRSSSSSNHRISRSRDHDETTEPKSGPATHREAESLGRDVNVVKMDCESGTAKCHVIHCTIEMIEPRDSVVVAILSRLWQSTLIEDYRNVDQVHISSMARLDIEFSDNIRPLNSLNDTDKATTIALPEIGIQEVKGVPLWIIIASVTVGVLFLCLVIWILWKCGFFRRKRRVNMKHKAVVEKPDYHYSLLQHSTITRTPQRSL